MMTPDERAEAIALARELTEAIALARELSEATALAHNPHTMALVKDTYMELSEIIAGVYEKAPDDVAADAVAIEALCYMLAAVLTFEVHDDRERLGQNIVLAGTRVMKMAFEIFDDAATPRPAARN